MNTAVFKNLPVAQAVELPSLVANRDGEIVSRTLAQNPHGNVTLFAFAAGEAISTHASHGDALITVLSGSARITVGETTQDVPAGSSILMPANIPHAVEAVEDFKMILLVLFPPEAEQ